METYPQVNHLACLLTAAWDLTPNESHREISWHIGEKERKQGIRGDDLAILSNILCLLCKR
jgi:hypothetical protein